MRAWLTTYSQHVAEETADSSWGKVIGITVAACVLVGGLLWLVVPKGAPVKNAEPEPSAPVLQNQAANAAKKVKESVRGQRPSLAERLEKRLGKPPKLSVQLSDPARGTCPDFFMVPLVVRVIRGDFDDVVAEVRIPHDKMTRTRTLMYADGDWTASIGGLPINRTVQLVIMASGPSGTETVTKDVSHICPGDPVDKDPYDLVGKDARAELRKNLTFDFDFGSADKKSG